MLQRCSKDSSKMLQRCSRDAPEMLQRCSRDAPEMLQRCSRDLTTFLNIFKTIILGDSWRFLEILGDSWGFFEEAGPDEIIDQRLRNEIINENADRET